jgi:uncharacterized protein YfdQ (DUF2303 family)
VTDRTETDAILDRAPRPTVLPIADERDESSELRLVSVPEGWDHELIDLAGRLDHPHRHSGTQEVITVSSFIEELRRRQLDDEASRIFADARDMKLVAVLNDDDGEPGWRDYRVEYALTRSPEWQHWLSADGVDLTLEQLARHIEDGMAEIVSPSAADMLELAQTFHATNEATFKRGTRLSSGAQTFVYTEDIQAAGGASGTMEIPTELELKLAPFYGSDAVSIQAWFRFSLKGPDLRVSYKIQRPETIELDAFRDLVALLEGSLTDGDPGITSGPAPKAR